MTNLRSLPPKIDELQLVAKVNNASVISITETWLTNDISDSVNCLYPRLHSDDRHIFPTKVLVVESVPIFSIKFQQKDFSFESDNLETLWITLTIPPPATYIDYTIWSNILPSEQLPKIGGSDHYTILTSRDTPRILECIRWFVILCKLFTNIVSSLREFLKPVLFKESSYEAPGFIILTTVCTLSSLMLKYSVIADHAGAAYSRLGLITLSYTCFVWRFFN